MSMGTNRFRHRSEAEEIMDDLNSAGHTMEQTLHELEIINKRLGGNRVTINALERLLSRNPPSQKLTIADIGCGRGDILIAVAKWMSKRQGKVELVGIDANPHIIDIARRNSAQYPQIRFETANVFSDRFKNQHYDIIISSLFTHHFKDQDLIALFSLLKQQTKIGVIINDLHRHRLAYYAIKAIVHVFSKSPMVQHDAPVSVLRAFRKEELKEIMAAAGITTYSLQWMWAFRWQLIF